ncbi:hypothetical protein EW145_g7303 [Phellinidium pouzarii]|uniref:UV-endonuclease UvdE n=1 Tax=Phellinidium pouzarii TaxID=167371 RepID=A0A4V3XAR8_9AGAM|nr:hypothetical protein EW145_g7303 [Phellinidium pouzarii]
MSKDFSSDIVSLGRASIIAEGPKLIQGLTRSDASMVAETVKSEENDKNPKRPNRKRKYAEPTVLDGEDLFEVDEKPKRVRKRKVAAAAAAAVGDVDGKRAEGSEQKKKRRRKTPEEDKVYDIPPIENVLKTTFKGRLGYACLNSLLRSYSTSIFCSRTCRLATLIDLGPQHVHTLALQNLADLHTLINWNAQNGIYFMRMSSEMFPFASHPEHGYDLSFADKELKEIGKLARKSGVRLTSHPGQFTQLGSPTQKVVNNAFRDLIYHCEIMDRMDLDQDSVMIIHMGGMYGDKLATLERFKENYAKLPENVKGRLVLENDEMCYNVDDLLPICQELHIPLVFDYHHDWIYPSSRSPAELIPEINQIWHDKNIKPKQHYSEPRPRAQTVMEKRAHSDRVARLPEALPDDMDLMLECKDKEQAVFHLYRLYGLCEVDTRVLRPPAAEESLQTKGRKSTKRARAKAAAEAENEIDAGTEMGGDEKKKELVLKDEILREAEEHGLPFEATVGAVAKLAADGKLDCGSGDEEAVDVGAASNSRKAKQKKPAKNQDKEAKAITHRESTHDSTSKARRRRKAKGKDAE